MCRATDALRHIVGISDYVPGSYPHSRVRRPTRYGARSRNGHAPVATTEPQAVVADLAREHRLIRQILADIDCHRARGQG